MYKKLIAFAAFVTIFISGISIAFAINDVQVIDIVNFHLLTADTSAATTVTAAVGGQVTAFSVQSNYIDITVDNLSQVTFNTVFPGNYLRVIRQSGSTDYTVAPACPGTTATLTGTGAQVVLRLQVLTTNPCTPVVNIIQSGGSTDVTEGGASDTYTISLPTAPTGNVTITITPDSSITVSPGSLIFTPLNWNVPQTVTVTAVNDLLAQGPHTGIIIHTAVSTDPLYNGLAIAGITVNITDNDTGGGGGGGGGGSAYFGQPASSGGINVQPQTSSGLVCDRTMDTVVPFTDTVGHWGETYIDTLYRRCIVDGRSFFLFEPDQEITRAETVKIVLNTYNFGPTPWQNLYPDVLSTDWFAGFVTTASTFGIVQGYLENGIYYFKPNQLVTRAEALKIVLRTKGITDFSGYTTTFTDVQKGDWYYDYIAFAQAKGIMEGYMEGTQVRPNSYITRAELSKIDLVVEQLL